MPTQRILIGDARAMLATLPDASVHCCITSPPYFGLRDYNAPGQIGLEPTLAAYIATLVDVFREVKRVLRDDGTVWLNLGDSYNNFRTQKGPGQSVHGRDKLNGKPEPLSGGRGDASLKEKDLMMVPARVAIALVDDGWYLRSDIIWAKPNPMPESVQDRPTSAHEHVFLLSKSPKYFYDGDAIREPHADPDRGIGGHESGNPHAHKNIEQGATWVPATRQYNPLGRNRRNVWTISTTPFKGAAVYGTYRITSPDCPIHGCQDDRGDVPRCDELPAVSLSARSPDSDGSPDQELTGVASATPLGLFVSLSDASAATRHSTSTHRTADESGQGATSADTPSSRTEYTEPLPHSTATYAHTPASSTSPDALPDASDLCLPEQTDDHTVGIPTFDPPPANCSCNYTGKVEKKSDHFAVFPHKLVEPMILAGCPEGGTVLDPFLGSGTTLMVADWKGRNGIGIELSPEYAEMARTRICSKGVMFTEVSVA